MHGGETAGDAEREIERAPPRYRTRQVVQRLARHQLVGQIRPAVDGADAVDAGDVRVVEASDRPRLVEEALVGAAIRGLGVDELEGDRAVEHAVAPEEDRAHVPCPQRPEHVVVVELSGWERRRCGAVGRHTPS